jgi:hypothetical protein
MDLHPRTVWLHGAAVLAFCLSGGGFHARPGAFEKSMVPVHYHPLSLSGYAHSAGAHLAPIVSSSKEGCQFVETARSCPLCVPRTFTTCHVFCRERSPAHFR